MSGWMSYSLTPFNMLPTISKHYVMLVLLRTWQAWEACFDSLTYLLLVAWFACHLWVVVQKHISVYVWNVLTRFALACVLDRALPGRSYLIRQHLAKPRCFFKFFRCWFFEITSLLSGSPVWLQHGSCWRLLIQLTFQMSHVSVVAAPSVFWCFILVTPRLVLFLLSPNLTKLRNAWKKAAGFVCLGLG